MESTHFTLVIITNNHKYTPKLQLYPFYVCTSFDTSGTDTTTINLFTLLWNFPEKIQHGVPTVSRIPVFDSTWVPIFKV